MEQDCLQINLLTQKPQGVSKTLTDKVMICRDEETSDS